ncbi:MAG: pseudouridine synthase, partial [Candidatus Rokuibacteriota bacterium]
GPARAEEARRLRAAGPGRDWIALTLREGRYREVKRLCRAVGLPVRRLIRVAYGPLRLGTLAPGASRELTARELATLGAAGGRGARGATRGSI